MHRYLVEHRVPHAGKLTAVELKDIAQQSLLVQQSLGDGIQWLQSVLTGDRMFCLYLAAEEGIVREHAWRSGLPIECISRVTAVIGPANNIL